MNKYLFAGLSLSCMLVVAAPLAIAKGLPENSIQMSNVLQNLHDSGYDVVLKVDFDGRVFNAKVIDSNGKEVNVKITPKAGEVLKAKNEKPNLSMMDAVKKVEEAGYHNIYKVNMNSGKYQIKAFDNKNKKVSLEVDAKSGKIHKDWF